MRARVIAMPGIDYAIYFVHGLFWAPFGVARLIARRQAPAGDAPAAAAESTAPFSRTLIGIHAFAFALMYFGLARAVMPGRVPRWFPGQRVVGAVIIIGGGLLMGWAVASFESWRFRAALAAGHRLATGGPFRAIRHPIYLGLFLLALGTAIWVPAPIVWA